MSRRLVLVFAVATGLIVANNYYAQPLLEAIAREFRAGSGAVGLVVTAAQVGYGLGLLLIVPLGDLVDRRKLVVGVLGATAVGLLANALAPSLAALIAASFVVGVTSVVAQVLVPFAATLASEAERGKVVGTVMSGLLLGILLARTAAGAIAQIAGWRAVYAIAAALMLVLMAALGRELPRLPIAGRLTRRAYLDLLRSVGGLINELPLLRRRSIYGGLTFAMFSTLWTSLAFLLARPPYGYGEAIIGLFGLLGAAGAIMASVAGRLADRGLARVTTGAGLLATFAAFGLLALGATALVPLVLGIVLLDLGAQGTHITNQSLIYRLRPEARSRLTTAYMTTFFVGGALGSATSALAFERAGWPGVCLTGAAYGAIALLIWLTRILLPREEGVEDAATSGVLDL